MKKIILCLISIVITISLFSSCSLSKKVYPEMTISFLKVGKADTMIIKTSEHTVLIDTADQGEGKDIYNFCNNIGVTSLDYLILTHFDKDHVGGAKAVLDKFENIENIIQPGYAEDSDEFFKYTAKAEEKGYVPVVPDDTMTFTLDDAIFTVYPALEDEYEAVNNYSLAITVEYGEKMFLFAGDAENKRLGELMLQLPVRKSGYDLIKMPHHGVVEKRTDEFIKFVNPEIAVITCSQKEPADEETIQILENNNTQIFYTYNGDITFKCDGYNIIQ